MDQGIQNNSGEFQAGVVQKKKKPVGIIAGIAAAVIVGGGAAAYAFVPVVHNMVNMTIMSNEKYCADVYKNNIKKANKDIKESYSKFYDIYGTDKGINETLSVSAELDDSILADAKTSLDSDLFKELKLSCNESFKNGVGGGELELTADGKRVLGADLVIDMADDMSYYIRVPELKEDYLKISLKDYMEQSGTDIDFDFDKLKNPSDMLLKPDDVEDMITRYSAIVTDCVSEGADLEKSFSGKVQDVDYKYNKLTTKLDKEKGEKLLDGFAKELENDKVLKSYLIDKLGMPEDEWDSMVEDLKKTEDNEISDSTDASITTYVDAEGTIRGFSLSDDEDEVMSYILAKDGDKIAAEFKVNDEFSCVADVEDKDGKYNGDVTITADSDVVTVTLDNVETVDDQYMKGTVSIDASAVSDVPVIALNFDTDGKSQEVSTQIDKVGKITVKTALDTPEDIKVPDKAIESIEEYTADLDSAKLQEYAKNAIIALGVNEEYADLIVQQYLNGALGDLTGEITGNNDPMTIDPADPAEGLVTPGIGDDPNNQVTTTGDDPDADEIEDEVEVSFATLNLQVNGKAVSLTEACKPDDSMIPADKKAEKIQADDGDILYSDDYAVCYSIRNNTTGELDISQCDLTEVSIMEQTANALFNGISIGSKPEDVAKAFGMATIDPKISTLYITDTEDFMKYAYISFENGVVNYISVSLG